MDSNNSDPFEQPRLASTASEGIKVVIIGGFGVGKTTLVQAVSEIRPLSTEETMTRASEGIDDLRRGTGKTSTTVAFDFGRITLTQERVLYLFGAPGQERFWFLWDRLFLGSLGAVVLVDDRRLDDSFYAIDRLEAAGTPFIVARNRFGRNQHSLDAVRGALQLSERVPLIDCDARDRQSCKDALIALVEHLFTLHSAREAV